MNQPTNVLFSTTRQWNPGDEFILFGVRRILGSLNWNYNPVVYNRHPGINPPPLVYQGRFKKPARRRTFDNSFAFQSSSALDYVIFAGSPEWYQGRRIDPLLRFILDHDLRCAFLGVGMHRVRTITPLLQKVIETSTDSIIVRDDNALDAVLDYFPEAIRLSCPALFSARSATTRSSKHTIGIVLQAPSSSLHGIPHHLTNALIGAAGKLQDRYEIRFIAHYIDDFIFARKVGLTPVFYSGFAEDFAEFFAPCDAVISTRVHGCGMASSLGIPNALIRHDGRAETVTGFSTTILNQPESAAEWLDSLDVQEVSSQLVALRSFQEQQWKEVLLNQIKSLGH